MDQGSIVLGEFIGTMILIAFGGGISASVGLEKTYANGGSWLLVCFGWALGVL